MQAIGMIETRGLVAAIESADAMLKAAEVRLLERSLVKGGIVTITVTGDVAACKASVDAGVAAVDRMKGQVLSRHVIPRPHESLEILIGKEKKPDTERPSFEVQEEKKETPPSPAVSRSLKERVEERVAKEGAGGLEELLQSERAGKLRNLVAAEYPGLVEEGNSPLDLTKSEIIAKLKSFYEKET